MSVRHVTLALAGLLTAAAPPQQSLMQAAAECRLPRTEMFAALKTFPVERTVDRSSGSDRAVNSIYTFPADLKVYGFTVVALGAADILSSSDERVLLMATVKAPYAQVERAVLAANNVTECDIRGDSSDGENCGVYARQIDGWRVAVVLKQYDDEVGIACSFSRRP